MPAIVSNSSRENRYYLQHRLDFSKNIYEFLNIDLIRSSSLHAHEKNSRNFIQRPDLYHPVVENLYLIPPKTNWLLSNNKFSLIHNIKKHPITAGTLEEVLYKASKYTTLLRDANLAVEVSGGLDTSLVLATLNRLNIDPTLIGVQSNRYEFRTEYHIQEIQMANSNKVIRIDGELTLPFSQLLKTPVHPLPTTASLFHQRHKIVSDACVDNKINLLLTGVGGDALLCPSLETENAMPVDFEPWMLDDYWANENIYRKKQVTYFSPFTLIEISKLIFSMRSGFKEDSKKIWARNFFKSELPNELVNYTYKAAYDGMYHESMLKALPDILEVCKIAYDLTKQENIHPREIASLVEKSIHLGHHESVMLMSRISYANWVYPLIRDGLI